MAGSILATQFYYEVSLGARAELKALSITGTI